MQQLVEHGELHHRHLAALSVVKHLVHQAGRWNSRQRWSMDVPAAIHRTGAQVDGQPARRGRKSLSPGHLASLLKKEADRSHQQGPASRTARKFQRHSNARICADTCTPPR